MRHAPAVPLLLLATLSCGGEDLVLPNEGQPAAIAAVGGGDQQGTVGGKLGDPIAVRVTDRLDRPVMGQRVAFVVLAGGDGAALAPDTAVTGADGRASARWTLGALAGAQRVAARVVAAGAPLETTFDARAMAAAADTVAAVAGQNQAAPPAQPLPDSLAVRVTDAFGNPIAGVAVRWAAAGGGSVSPGSATTGADGRAAARRMLGPALGSYPTTATASGLRGSPVSFQAIAAYPPGSQPASVAPSAGDGQTAPVGTTVPTAPAVVVRNGSGDPMAGVPVVFQTGSGTVTGASPVTDGSGVAQVGSWTLGTRAGAQTLVASVAGGSVSGNPVTFTATAEPGPADPRQTHAVVPASAPLFTVLRFTVFAEDQYGNQLTTGGDPIAATLRRGQSGTPMQMADRGDGTYTASALLLLPGNLSVDVTLSGQPVNGSPYRIQVGGGGGGD
jgi:adhesin/invasin